MVVFKNSCLGLSWGKCVVEAECAPLGEGKEALASLKMDGSSLSDERMALTDCRVGDTKPCLSPVRPFLWWVEGFKLWSLFGMRYL